MTYTPPAPSWNTVRVFGTWHNLDGTMKAGQWSLTFPVRVVNTTGEDKFIIPKGTRSGNLQTTLVDRTVTDGAMTAGSHALTSATAAFTSADVGKVVMVGGAGTAGADLETVISVVVSGTQATVADPASTTVTGASVEVQNPSLDIPVPATDDPDNTPNGWQYKLVVTFTDQSPPETYALSVPLAGGDINLADIVLTQTFTTSAVLIRGVPGGLAGLNADGLVVDAAGDVVGSSGLVVSPTEPPAGWEVWFEIDPTTGALLDIRTP